MKKAAKAKIKLLTGFRLDVGCGDNKQVGFIGMDKRQIKGPDGKDLVDIVHDIEVFPWPIKDGAVLDILCSHIVEHIKPWLMIGVFDEMWRVMQPGGKLIVALPYSLNRFFVQDPTHCNPCNEATFTYFDPRYPLYAIYKPKPWLISKGFPSYHKNGILECLMQKLTLADAERVKKGGVPVDVPMPAESKKLEIQEASIRQGFPQKGT